MYSVVSEQPQSQGSQPLNRNDASVVTNQPQATTTTTPEKYIEKVELKNLDEIDAEEKKRREESNRTSGNETGCLACCEQFIDNLLCWVFICEPQRHHGGCCNDEEGCCCGDDCCNCGDDCCTFEDDCCNCGDCGDCDCGECDCFSS